jgi:hypothetical protein
VKDLARALGAELHASNARGGGLCVALLLPRAT